MNASIASPLNHRIVQKGDLTLPEQIVLWVVRKHIEAYAADDKECRLMAMQEVYFSVFGIAFLEAAQAATHKFIHILHAHTRHALRFHPAPHGAVSIDEWRVLSLIAAHQAEHVEYAAAVTRWLVPAVHADLLRDNAAVIARTLKHRNLVCPLRFSRAGPLSVAIDCSTAAPSPQTLQ